MGDDREVWKGSNYSKETGWRQRKHVAVPWNGRNLFAQFLEEQKEKDDQRTQRWWASRWQVNPSMVGLWAAGRRRISVRYPQVLRDMLEIGGITMEEYDISYEETKRLPSEQVPTPESHKPKRRPRRRRIVRGPR